MVKDTDDSAPADQIVEVLAAPCNRLNANIGTAGDDGIHRNAVRQAALIIQNRGRTQSARTGKFRFCRHRHGEALRAVLPRCRHPGGPRSFAIGLEAANLVMDVFSREHDPRSAGTPFYWRVNGGCLTFGDFSFKWK
jgi:hypothetical protein